MTTYLYLYSLLISSLGMAATVDREIFVRKNFRLLNFRGFIFVTSASAEVFDALII